MLVDYDYDERISKNLNAALSFFQNEQGLINLLTYTTIQSKDFSVLEYILKNKFSLLPDNSYDLDTLKNMSGDTLDQLDFFGEQPEKQKKERKKRVSKVGIEEDKDALNFADEGVYTPAIKTEKGIIEINEHFMIKCNPQIALDYLKKFNHITNSDDQYDFLVDLLKNDALADISDLKIFYRIIKKKAP